CRKTHNTEDAVQRLRQHALNFTADKTRSGQVEVGKRQHVALDAALLLLVERHDHEHGDKGAGRGGHHAQGGSLKFGRGLQEMERQPQDSPGGKRKTEEPVGKSFLAAAFLPEDGGDGEVEERSRNNRRDREFIGGVCCGPKSQEADNQKGQQFPGLPLRINLSTKKKQNGGKPEEPMRQRVFKRTGHGRKDVMKTKNEPGRGPKQEVILALNAVDVGEEARNKKHGDQQREGNKALIYQAQSISPPTKQTAVRSNEGAEFLRVVCSLQACPSSIRPRGNCAATQKAAPRHNTRYCDYGLGNFQEASVPGYWLPKRQHHGGNRFMAKDVEEKATICG